MTDHELTQELAAWMGDSARVYLVRTDHLIIALRDRLLEAKRRIDALEDAMNPQDVCDVDSRLRGVL